MEKTHKGIFRQSITYFFLLLFCIVLGLVISSFLSNFIGFIPNVESIREILNGILGFIVEVVFVLFFFYKSFYNDRNSKLSVSFISFGIACVLQFLLAYLNHFHPYTAGACVTDFGYVLYFRTHTFESGLTPFDIPVLYFIIPLLILDAILFGILYLSFLLARRKRKKETEKLMKETKSTLTQE